MPRRVIEALSSDGSWRKTSLKSAHSENVQKIIAAPMDKTMMNCVSKL